MLPDSAPDDPMEMMRLIVDDLDVDSVAFVATERTISAYQKMLDLPDTTDPRIKVLTMTASLWLDGLLFGMRFDVEGGK
jgi:hypothetical protein